jgi:hypothetical protein
MGFQITFVPPEEKMVTYKPWNENMVNYKEAIKNTKRELISYCLKNHDNDDTRKIATTIGFNLRMLISSIELDEKFSAYKRWKEDADHELWYCGWQFSHECEIDKEGIIEQTIDELTILADVVKTPDYFEDIDKFTRKREDIIEHLDDFECTMSDIAIYGIIDELREFEKKYDDEEENVDFSTSTFNAARDVAEKTVQAIFTEKQIQGIADSGLIKEDAKTNIAMTSDKPFDDKYKVDDSLYDFTSAPNDEVLDAYKNLGANDLISVKRENKEDNKELCK